MIEQEIFKRRVILFDSLEKFGFIRTKDGFTLDRPIFEGMVARLLVRSDGSVVGKVFDPDLDEEYVLFRNEQASGAFVVGVRNAFESLLNEVAEAVSLPKTYIGDQTMRIDREIRSRYGVMPEFLWEKFPHFGVYRNAASGKWFAIIMNVAKKKVVPGAEGEAEVMNLKLAECAEAYLGEGVFPSYHMNHKNWVTVLLDGTLPDQKILEMVDLSYRNSIKKNKK